MLRVSQESQQYAPKGQKPIAQGNTLGESITNTNAPCKGKSVNYQCFCPCRAFCCFQSVHPRRCPGLCAFWAFSPLCLTFDTSSKVFPSFYCRFSSVFQKESFCLSKRVLLHSKTSPFAYKKEKNSTPKGPLLSRRTLVASIKP